MKLAATSCQDGCETVLEAKLFEILRDPEETRAAFVRGASRRGRGRFRERRPSPLTGTSWKSNIRQRGSFSPSICCKKPTRKASPIVCTSRASITSLSGDEYCIGPAQQLLQDCFSLLLNDQALLRPGFPEGRWKTKLRPARRRIAALLELGRGSREPNMTPAGLGIS